MQVTDKNGNIFGPHGLQVNGSDGKPKTTGGGSSPLTTKGDIYVRNATSDTRLPVGLDTQMLLADSSTSTGLKWTSQPVPTPTGYYAQYQDDITQPLVAVNVGQATKFRTMDFSNGVTVVSNTRITLAHTGIYNLQFSFQFQNLDTQEHDVTIWLRKNGVDVDGSAGFVAVVSKHGGIPGHCITSWNYLLDAVGGDYYELYWSSTSTQVTMEFYPAGSPPPSTASAIFTVTQQAGIMAGTGITALNGLSTDVQTFATNVSGSDFNISSSGSTHTFNLPTASATNRGALSTTDWSAFNGKQDALISGTNIKTVNSTSLLGSGNIAVQPTLVSGTNIKTVNGNSLLGSGDVTISSNPRLLGFSGINGTNSSSTAITICHSLLIPANTLTTNSILQLVFRMNRVSGNTGQMYGRIYFNTSNSLTGASLFNTIFTMNGGSTQFLGYVERNFSYDGTNLTSYSNTAYSEYTTGTALSVAFNRTVNNWVLFTMQAQTGTEIANINLFKVFAYV